MNLSAPELNAVRLSLQVALTAVLISLPSAIAIGYVLAKFSFKGKFILQNIIDLPLVLPPVVTGYFLLVLMGPRGPVGSILESMFHIRIAFTWIGAALASAIVSYPLMVRSIRSAFVSLDPRLELVSQSLGVTPWKTFLQISLPLAGNGIFAGCLLAFARSIGEFGATIMIAGDIPGQTRTIPLAIYSLSNTIGGIKSGWSLVLVAVVLSSVSLFFGEILERRNKKYEHS
ncbi:molybdate ABC transporter permease subunit [Synechococcus sp. AH-551-E05]|jgi:molybdate transport system permease protein|nr:molybdate ABC transporter permease subunit [Synechococcus sp. AH-551-E05]MDB4651288.1 molybdate ABC transporter permease subunit [Synechococcus sp. AH-551-E05]